MAAILHTALSISFTEFTDTYRKTSNISQTLVGNKIVGAAPTTSSFST